MGRNAGLKLTLAGPAFSTLQLRETGSGGEGLLTYESISFFTFSRITPLDSFYPDPVFSSYLSRCCNETQCTEALRPFGPVPPR